MCQFQKMDENNKIVLNNKNCVFVFSEKFLNYILRLGILFLLFLV